MKSLMLVTSWWAVKYDQYVQHKAALNFIFSKMVFSVFQSLKIKELILFANFWYQILTSSRLLWKVFQGFFCGSDANVDSPHDQKYLSQFIQNPVEIQRHWGEALVGSCQATYWLREEYPRFHWGGVLFDFSGVEVSQCYVYVYICKQIHKK